jgi:hypothetical protein
MTYLPLYIIKDKFRKTINRSSKGYGSNYQQVSKVKQSLLEKLRTVQHGQGEHKEHNPSLPPENCNTEN